MNFSTPVNWNTCCGPLFQDGDTWTVGLSTSHLTGWTRTDGTVLDLEGHFDTGPLKHTLLVGGDYYNLRAVYDSQYSNTNGPYFNVPLYSSVVPSTAAIPIDPNSFYYTDTTTRSYGLYAQDQIKLPHSIEILGGLRYQHVADQRVLNEWDRLLRRVRDSESFEPASGSCGHAPRRVVVAAAREHQPLCKLYQRTSAQPTARPPIGAASR